jgi:hypothetical protein
MRRIFWAALCAMLLAGGSVSGALATTTRIPVATPGHGFIPLEPGTWTMNGTVQSVRGFVVSEPATWNNPYADGDEINTINWDVDLATGIGTLWGSGIHHPTAFAGSTWLCTFEAAVTGMTPAGFEFTGKGVCHGTGALHTWQWRVNLWSTPTQGTAAAGYIFKPGD